MLNLFDRPHYQTQPAYSRDTSMYRISIQNVNLNSKQEFVLLNFLSPREKTLPKIFLPKPNSHSTSPVYSRDTSKYRISI